MGKSKELRNWSDFNTMMSEVLIDALSRLQLHIERDVTFEEVTVYSWPQVWSDGSCGFGKPAGQALTSAQTVLVMLGGSGPVCVYHRGQFAYLVKHPGKHFWMGMTVYHLPGADDVERIRRLEHEADDE